MMIRKLIPSIAITAALLAGGSAFAADKPAATPATTPAATAAPANAKEPAQVATKAKAGKRHHKAKAKVAATDSKTTK